MTRSTAQADLVIEGHARIRAAAADYSTLFYHRLFERHPFVRSPFPDDLAPQVGVFRSTIDALMAAITDMRRRRAAYCVKAAHYGFVGEVLIDTIAELSGDAFDDDDRVA